MKPLATSFLLFASVIVMAQQSVEVFFDKEHELAYYIHEVESKETLYGLSKTYGAAVADIMHINKLRVPALDLGQRLVIPFQNSSIQYKRYTHESHDFIPVYYQVRRRETAFRICRSYFEVNLTAIKELNDLRRNSLSADQQLLIGYLKRHDAKQINRGIHEEQQVRKIDEIAIERLEPPDQEIEITSSIPVDDRVFSINYDNGAAFWNKAATGLNGYFVLHRYAERNSWIEVTNPMYDVSIQAKVIGNIPSTGYPSDVLVVVSPSIAKDLGALDERFYVKVRYLRAESQLTKSK